MRTTVSLPDELFQRVERLRSWTNRARSEIYADALSEYVSRHYDDEITAALNRVLEQVSDEEKEADRLFLEAAARDVFKRTEW